MINSITRSTIQTKTQYRKMSAGNPRYSDMELIATTVVGSANLNSVVFSSITQNYRHLQIRVVAALSATDPRLQINGDTTGANYAIHRLGGNGSTVYSNAYTATGYIPAGTNTSTTVFQASIVDILDYTSTTKNKTVRTLAGASTSAVELWSGVWLSTAAITSLNVYTTGTTFVAGSRISLYGIKG